MSRVAMLLSFVLVTFWHTALSNVPGGRSPNGEFEIVDVEIDRVIGRDDHYREHHFELRDKSGKPILSELSLEDLTFTVDNSPRVHVFGGASKVLWRGDSRFVAVATQTSKFAIRTIVFFRDGETFNRVPIPEYEPFVWDPGNPAMYGSSDTTHREPLRWRRNGDLILDITMGYHAKYPGVASDTLQPSISRATRRRL